jgi:hypothetical protein
MNRLRFIDGKFCGNLQWEKGDQVNMPGTSLLVAMLVVALVEGLLIIGLGRPLGLYLCRFFIIWGIVSFLSFVFFLVLGWFAEDSAGCFWLIGEVLFVIPTQAAIIRCAFAKPFVTRFPSKLSWTTAIAYIVIANTLAFLCGILVIIFAFW